MPIYKKINGSYEKIDPLYIKDDSGEYFDPLGGVYVKDDDGIYYKVYPDPRPCFFSMSFCDESTPYDDETTWTNDISSYNVAVSQANYIFHSINFVPDRTYGNKNALTGNKSSPVDIEFCPIVGSSSQFTNWINTYEKSTCPFLYVNVDNSGSMNYEDIADELQLFLNNLPYEWSWVTYKKYERWLYEIAKSINDFTSCKTENPNLFVMSICDEASNYMTAGTWELDVEKYQNLILEKSYYIPTICFQPSILNIDEMTGGHYDNKCSPVKIESTNRSGNKYQFKDWLDYQINNCGVGNSPILVINVDDSGSMKYNDIETELLEFLDNIVSDPLTDTNESYMSSDGNNTYHKYTTGNWTIYINDCGYRTEHWLYWIIDAINNFGS